ncbi:PTS mannose/fructose/sorbose transporter family subunit IID [Aerococcaceae bacterium INB8]|uniref:PTS mannose/fructose/sorbose transporter family subunit IID n=1 Tax=Ruoffia halotolerans TaxID=2748684 RepID=A0A839A5G5_9LACT|nr:PTS system mannose/fructose/sorbose family transporter subunit IID [Ruoffia halotolerans]MBA5729257.1 PTS mannose/fructose/sorbose transporter family subunit IID [Ruoffia halotolerans]
MTEEVRKDRIKLTRADRMRVSWRMTFIQACWNFERMHNVGWVYALIPAIRKLYTTKEDRSAALQRHLEFINTHPYLQAPIAGVVLALEEEKANGTDIDDQAIQGVKVGMMGPLAGVGDPVFWGTLRPVLGAFAASLALSESIFGPIIFFLAWNIIRILFLWYTQELGYRSGNEITKDLSGGVLQKITQGASILGMFIMGVLVPRWTTMNFPLVLSQVENNPDTMVDFQALTDQANSNALSVDTIRDIILQVQSGANVATETTMTLNDVLNDLLPGLMPLILTFACIWLLRKKVSPIAIIGGIFVLGIALYSVGIMG